MCKESGEFSGYAIASALSHMYRYDRRARELIDDNCPGFSGRMFSTPSAIPPPLDETLPTDLIDWPNKNEI